MAWTTSVIVTACASLGLWRHYTTPSTDLLATDYLPKQVEHADTTASLNFTTSVVAETLTEHTASELLAVSAQQAQVGVMAKEEETIEHRPATSQLAHTGFLVGEPFLHGSTVNPLWCAKPADQEGLSQQAPSEQALAPTLAVLSYCWILPYLEILAMLCCCYRCRAKKDEDEIDHDVEDDEEVVNSESERVDGLEEIEQSSFQDVLEFAEVEAEGGCQEITAVSKNDHLHEGHVDLEHRLMDLPTPARAPASRAGATQCKDDDDLARAERLLQEERWVLDDPIGIIFEEEEDELEFHRKRSKILGCFARALSQLLQEDSKLREAGAALLEDIDRLEEEKGQAQGDAAYWRTLAEDFVSKQMEGLPLETTEACLDSHDS